MIIKLALLARCKLRAYADKATFWVCAAKRRLRIYFGLKI